MEKWNYISRAYVIRLQIRLVPNEKYENRTELYEELCNSEPTSDVNNSKQSAICNTKDEQPSIQFIVIYHFTFAAIRLYILLSQLFPPPPHPPPYI